MSDHLEMAFSITGEPTLTRMGPRMLAILKTGFRMAKVRRLGGLIRNWLDTNILGRSKPTSRTGKANIPMRMARFILVISKMMYRLGRVKKLGGRAQNLPVISMLGRLKTIS